MDPLDTEILVHITAPSRAVDDKNYRALAQAYLNFQPATRSHNLARGATSPQTQGNADDSAQGFESPKLSFRDVLDNLASPSLQKSVPGLSQGDGESQGWVAPPSVVGDSQPYNDVSISAFCSPTRILEHFLRTRATPSESSQELHRGPPARSDFDSSQDAVQYGDARGQVPSVPLGRNSASQKTTTSPISSAFIIPATQSSPRNAPEASSRKRQTYRDDAADETTMVSCTDPDVSLGLGIIASSVVPSSLADPDDTPRKRRKAQMDHAESLVQNPTNNEAGKANELAEDEAEEASRIKDYQKRLEVHAPEPAVSCSPLDHSSITTSMLSDMLTAMQMKRFEPKKQFREVEPFERGYWLIDTSTWSNRHKQETWGHLARNIGNGKAGWSVWCQRDAAWNWIRYYCFGAVMPHVYFVLYLGCRRALKYTGASWYGGDGKVVVTILPRTNGAGSEAGTLSAAFLEFQERLGWAFT